LSPLEENVNRLISQVRRPVRREGAENHMLLTLLSFAASVALTRLFLELTGYPQLGGGGLHIAHVLWGGLALFVAALLPLIYANRWVYRLGALLAGIGVGLFIDEVGKFVTQTNDYFYPGAAPIVYACFLLTVLVYVRVRRPKRRSARAELYRALDSLQEVLDHDLDSTERARLRARLAFVSEQREDRDLARLAEVLLGFLTSDELRLAPQLPTPLERIEARWQRWEARWLHAGRLRAALSGGLLALAVMAIADLVRLLSGARVPENLALWLEEVIRLTPVSDLRGLLWFLTRVGIESTVGLMSLGGGLLLLAGKEAWGLTLAYYSLLLSLTVVNLIVFYFEQFSTILPAAIQFLLFLGVMHYQRRFHHEKANEA
jgi:hypothetical protein